MELRIVCYAVLLIFIAKYAETCQINEIECTYIVNCTSYIDESVENYASFRFEPYSPRWIHNVQCNEPTIYYEYSQYYTVELIYKENPRNHDASIPQAIPNNEEFINIVYRLDISNNGYRQPPIIRSMANLAVLNLSRNYLTKAVLSNVYELKLTEIDLSYNNITEIRVYDFDYPFRLLQNINISHNHLLNIPNDVFNKFQNLQTLDLSHNNINSLNETVFKNMRVLSYLDLSNNRITNLNLSLKELSQLEKLNLSCNRIKHLELNEFQLLNKLKIMDLSNNQLEVIDSNAFSNLLSLQNIDLSNNKIKFLPMYLFQNTSITTFSITANRLEGLVAKGTFEGLNITKIDLSNQFFTEVSDYAFNKLENLRTLILNSNRIKYLSNKCFKTLINLEYLDLSNNEISDITFDKIDVSNLKHLLLSNNHLTEIKYEYFNNLNSLEYLDISENQISHIEPNSINSLHDLIYLKMNNNPLEGFPINNSFDGMTKLKEVNISDCEISELQYNIFIHTGHIEKLDLSFNKINRFIINLSELVNLTTLLLNNNILELIDIESFNTLSKLKLLNLSHNVLKKIHNQSFDDLFDLQYLDISYNDKLIFSGSLIRNIQKLNTLILSDVTTAVDGLDLNKSPISNLVMSNISVQNISQLNLSNMSYLVSLVLSYNNISKLQMEDFSQLRTLKHLDLSFNIISYIQPGVFKYNVLLESLNISHNFLTAIRYGVLRGLNSLATLDLSYNKLKDLQSETYFEVKHLSKLIVDFNQIITVNVRGFIGKRSLQLSIGDNPLPCTTLIHFKQYTFIEVTAINIDEQSAENVNGVTCNKNITDMTTTNEKVNANILQNVTNKRPTLYQHIENISIELKNSNQLLSKVVVDNEITNVILNNILKLLNSTHV